MKRNYWTGLAQRTETCLKNMSTRREEANQLTAVKNLIYGYRLGLTMTAEAFVGMDNLYAGGEDL